MFNSSFPTSPQTTKQPSLDATLTKTNQTVERQVHGGENFINASARKEIASN